MGAIERPQPLTLTSEPTSFEGIVRRIPDAVEMAKMEAKSSRLAHTPEGEYALTYLLAARNLMRPVLNDMRAIGSDLLTPTGGWEYNPQRMIDEIGTSIALHIARQTTNIPNLWMRVEEHAKWTPTRPNEGMWEECNRFAIIDPLDMTASIPRGDRVQTTGIAIYDRQGAVQAVGIMSLVDDGMLFMDEIDGKESNVTKGAGADKKLEEAAPLRVATLTRRMHALRDLPLFTSQHGVWVQDCVSGYALLSLLNKTVDTIVDPVKGNPWYEFLIWGAAAKAAGVPISDPSGKPIDISGIARFAIQKNPDENYRIQFVISKTPEIHQRVLSLLKPPTGK